MACIGREMKHWIDSSTWKVIASGTSLGGWGGGESQSASSCKHRRCHMATAAALKSGIGSTV